MCTVIHMGTVPGVPFVSFGELISGCNPAGGPTGALGPGAVVRMVVGQGQRWGAGRRPPGAQIAGASSARGAICLLGSGPREASCEALSPPGPVPPGNAPDSSPALLLSSVRCGQLGFHRHPVSCPGAVGPRKPYKLVVVHRGPCPPVTSPPPSCPAQGGSPV